MNKNFTINFLLILLLVNIIFFSSCAYQRPIVKMPEPKIEKITGIYHKVEAGQTLWGIAKAYNVDLENIVKINRIPNAARIEKGQLIFIPGITKETITDSESETFLKNKKFVWPVEGKIVSYFGSVNNEKINKGIDIRPGSGGNIIATESGKVVFSDDLKGYGKTIIIDHRDGFFSVYSNSSKFLVKLNDNISQGQKIAKLENLDNSNSFLHFEIRQNHRPKNPLYFLP